MRNITLTLLLFCLFCTTKGQNIAGYEYWFDYQSDERVKVNSPSENITLNLDVSNLREGIHFYNFRAKDSNGKWSAPVTQYFLRTKLNPTDNQLTQYEYWIDRNFVDRQSVISSNETINLNIDVATLNKGIYYFNFRAKDSDGKWSAPVTQYFYIPETVVTDNKIIAYEYWYNQSDSAKTRVDITPISPLDLQSQLFEINNLIPSATLDNFEFAVDVYGEAKIYYSNTNAFIIRFLDENDKWSSPSVNLFADGQGIDVVADTLYSDIPITKTRPNANEIHFYKLNALKGDSLIWKTNQPCTIQVFDPFGVEVYKATSYNCLSFNGIRAKRDGVYYVLLHSADAWIQQITLDYKHIHKYAVLGSNINKIGNNCNFTLKLTGNGFTNQTALLLRNGTNEILPQQILYYDIGEIHSTFVLNNVEIGNYDIVVTFGSDTIIVKNNAIIVETADVYASLSAQILGNTQYLAGSSNLYTVQIKNNSNIPAHNVPVTITIQCEDTTSIKKIKFHHKFIEIEEDILNNMFDQDEEIINMVKNYLKSDNDLTMFYAVIDSLGQVYFKCDLLILEIAPNSSIDFPFTIYENRSKIDIYASVPKIWNDGLPQSSENSILRSKSSSGSGKHLCCDDYVCIINLILGGVLGALDIDYVMTSEAVNCAAQMYLETFHITLFEDLGCLVAESGNHDEAVDRAKGMALNMVRAMAVQVMNCWFNHLGKKYGKEVARMMVGKAAAKLNIVINILINEAEAGVDCYINHISGKGWGQCGGDDEPEHLSSTPVNSRDPNDKYGYRSPSGSTYFKEDITNMTYVINFENDPEEATAAAQDVYITDTLDLTKFDINSFRAGYVRVADKFKQAAYDVQDHTWDIDMRPEMNLITRVNLTLNKEEGIAKWHFISIDPMTDEHVTDVFAGFLPPDDETGRGQGSVSFTINLKDDLTNDTEISNRAEIIFDYNEPIITPTWTNTKDIVPPVSQMLQPVELNDNAIRLSWEGADSGSGVWYYTVYARSGDEGDWYVLNNNTEQTETQFEYEQKVKYGFYVEAADKAGNKETKNPQAEVTFYKEVSGIAEISMTEPIVYPNPTNGILHIENAAGNEIKMYDTLGNLLIITKGNKIDMSNYSNGIYLLHINNRVVKVVKQ